MTGDDVEPSAASASDYRTLAREVRDAGLLHRRRGYYAVKIIGNLVLLAAAVTGIVLLGNSWWSLTMAVALAFVFTQMGFMGHDAGHGQIAASRRWNDVIGLLHATLLTGLSYDWWLSKHNTHHTHCNKEGKDPDIGPGPVAFTERQAHRKGGVIGMLIRSQVFFFFPLLLLEGINLHVNSVRALHQRGREAWVESLLLATHAAAFIGLLLATMSPLHALAFVAVNQALFGFYLGMTFVTNHTGMPILDEDETMCFLRRQVLTSRNVRGRSRIAGFVFGGLNLQIEHHLFPTMPRANLRRAQDMVRSFCGRCSIDYSESGVARAYAEVLIYLHQVSRPITPLLP